MKKLFKKNQVIIYIIALMLMTAGYLNYTTNPNNNNSVETSMDIEAKDDSKLADIGDAKLVSSNDIVPESSAENNSVNTNQTSNENNISMQNNMSNTSNTSTTENTVETNSTTTDEYFTKSKLERDTMYSQMIETYEKVLNSSNSLETQKQTATQEITKINNTKNGIMICENLIKTKGFENSIIFVNGESISVIIGVSEIKQEEVAQIQNIISREMNANIENIHIATK
ncbi:MAG: SpoIIIAH-like family protein [Clostridia bacterium]|nr:SpoIIIAH-like family protein [Clostridia bacterium]